MAVIQQKTQDIETMEVEQQRSMREWAVQRLPDKMLPLINGIDDITDIPKIYTNALKLCGFKNVVLVPHYDDIDEEWYYKPMFAMVALASFIGHKDPEHITRYTLKGHGTLTGIEILNKFGGG